MSALVSPGTSVSAQSLNLPTHSLIDALRASPFTGSERRQLMEIAEALSLTDCPQLLQSLSRSINGEPVLRQRDALGSTLLSNLHALALRDGSQPNVALPRAEMVRDILNTIADPSSNEQTVEFVKFLLAKK